jgi:uncharacterized MAPEG superfamily protein
MAAFYWCIFVAGMMPVAVASIARAGAHVDSKLPRDAVLSGWRRRTNAAHLNCYEAFPVFAVAVIAALMQHAPVSIVNSLTGIYVIVRICYVGLYIADWDRVRSFAFMAGLAINVAIFLLPVFAHT